MGLDLKLLPFDADHATIAFSHTVLNCERRRALFECLLDNLNALPVPEEFRSYLSTDQDFEEHHYGVTTVTPYGEPLTWVEVEALLSYGDHVDVKGNYLNRAIWAYLGCLPPRTKVALYWC